MKKYLFWLPVFFLLVAVLFAATPTVYAATSGVDISIDLPDGVKVGQTWNGVTPEIKVQSSSTRYTFTVGTGLEDIQVANNGQSFVQRDNTIFVSFNLYVQGLKEPIIPANLPFTINGTEYPVDQIFLQEGENGTYLRFENCAVHIDLSDRTTYTISPDGKDYSGYSISLYDMPTEAEAGVSITCNAEFVSMSGTDFLPYEIENYLVNGNPINSGESYTMPAENVTISAKVTDKYKDHSYISNVDITLDFVDPEIYYGKRIPTLNEFSDALKVAYNIPDLPIAYRFQEIAHFEDSAPWPGNIMLSFQLEAPEGYLFANPYVKEFDMDENGNETLPLKEWLDANLCVKVNGVETYYRLDPADNYAQGYFVSGYFCSPETLEIHIFWFAAKELTDLDLSGYQPGDKVTISDANWRWDGYMPTCYQLRYTNKFGEEMVTEFLGNSFTMPESNGDVKVFVNMVKGRYQTDDALYLPTPDVTPIQIQKIKDDDCGGVYYQVCDLANTVLNGQKVTFNKLDTPDGVFLEVVFAVNEDFDSLFIAFYRLTGDFCGYWEIVPALVDQETGLCHAILSHDGPPHIAHTYTNEYDTVCNVCGYGQGSEDGEDPDDNDQSDISDGGDTIDDRGYFAKLFAMLINWFMAFLEWFRSLH